MQRLPLWETGHSRELGSEPLEILHPQARTQISQGGHSQVFHLRRQKDLPRRWQADRSRWCSLRTDAPVGLVNRVLTPTNCAAGNLNPAQLGHACGVVKTAEALSA